MRCSHGACPEGKGLGIIRNWSRAVQPLLTTLAMLVVLTGNTSRVEASAMTWHADLDAASQASALSQKPVLVIFTAAWSPACERFVGSTLPTAEVGAILEACFEPVRLDVD
ncbi:MAG: thioredoxin family protein, partial [Planctomycetaceae bacterium]